MGHCLPFARSNELMATHCFDPNNVESPLKIFESHGNPFRSDNDFARVSLRRGETVLWQQPSPRLSYLWVSDEDGVLVGLSNWSTFDFYNIVVWDLDGKLLLAWPFWWAVRYSAEEWPVQQARRSQCRTFCPYFSRLRERFQTVVEQTDGGAIVHGRLPQLPSLPIDDGSFPLRRTVLRFVPQVVCVAQLNSRCSPPELPWERVLEGDVAAFKRQREDIPHSCHEAYCERPPWYRRQDPDIRIRHERGLPVAVSVALPGRMGEAREPERVSFDLKLWHGPPEWDVERENQENPPVVQARPWGYWRGAVGHLR